MDVAVIGRRGERQADGLADGCEPLTRLGGRSAVMTTRLGDSDSFRFSESEKVQEGCSPHTPNHVFK